VIQEHTEVKYEIHANYGCLEASDKLK